MRHSLNLLWPDWPVSPRICLPWPLRLCLRMDTAMPDLRGYLGSQLWPSGVWSALYPPNRVSTPISLVSWDPGVISFQAFLQVSLSFPRSLYPVFVQVFLLSPWSPSALLSSATKAFCCVCYFTPWFFSSGISSWFEELISSSQSSFSVRNKVLSPLKTQVVLPE